jgi:hypothetical protein
MNDNPVLEDQSLELRERFEAIWVTKIVDPKPIEAGEQIASAKLTTEPARQFAALHLVMADLEFALECLIEADKLGFPDASNPQSRALIFSGVVAYARCFKEGVREIRLRPEDLDAVSAGFDREIHDYLIVLRDKHVAHSVNDFEYCEAVATVIGHIERSWRVGGGVGVIMKKMIGISGALVKRAIKHIGAVKGALSVDIELRRRVLYDEFDAAFAKDGKWEMAPLARISDRDGISKRRR